MLQDVAVAVHDQVGAFELGVVSEVFGLDRSAEGLPRPRFALCAAEPGPLRTSSGFGVQVEHGLDRLASADLVVVPGWRVHDEPPAALLQALRDAAARGAWVMSVCSGAFVLAAAGLLDGRRAVTHWMYADELAARYPQVRVDADVLYVQEGRVLTSAGTAAGIDASLFLLRVEHGAAVANAVARRMVVPPHRDGGQAQFVDRPVPVDERSDDLGPVLAWAQAHLQEELTVGRLARHAVMSERTFLRRFAAVTGTTPHRWVTDQRVWCAQQLLEQTDLGVEEVAQAAGFGTAAVLRHHFARRLHTSPQAYRRTFRPAARADVARGAAG